MFVFATGLVQPLVSTAMAAHDRVVLSASFIHLPHWYMCGPVPSAAIAARPARTFVPSDEPVHVVGTRHVKLLKETPETQSLDVRKARRLRSDNQVGHILADCRRALRRSAGGAGCHGGYFTAKGLKLLLVRNLSNDLDIEFDLEDWCALPTWRCARDEEG